VKEYKGGIMIFDHVNDSSVSDESIIIREFFVMNDIGIKTMPFTSWPSG